MLILVTGKGGKSGSWKIRAEQLGEAIGAEVFGQAEMAEVKSADIVVVVKRTPPRLIQTIRASGRPWVLDLVDGWPQPEGNAWPENVARRWLQARLRELEPTGVVFPTTRMLEDSGWQGPAIVLPHHAWPKYQPTPVAKDVHRVGYEGAERYLGRWLPLLQAECRSRGWEFVLNGDLASCQIGVALRDVTGYPAGAWKANTKLANLQALGLPALISPEQGYREFGSEAQIELVWPEHLAPALDCLADHSVRTRLSAIAQAAAPRIEAVARDYRRWLCTVASS